MKKTNGFSLMEAMTVLLIVSVIAAASAPMINKKMISAASDKSPWVWVGTNKNIAYNLTNEDQTASIGAINPGTGARFHISTKYDKKDKPQMSLWYYNISNFPIKWRLFANDTSLNLSNSETTPASSILIGKIKNMPDNTSNITAIGTDVTPANNSVVVGAGAQSGVSGVAVGHYAHSNGNKSIAIGGGDSNNNNDNLVSGENSIAIGYNSKVAHEKDTYDLKNSTALGAYSQVNFSNSTALGAYSQVNNSNSIAIGSHAKAKGQNSIAIGTNVKAENDNDFILGNENNHVKIPGEVYFKNKVIIPLEDITFEQNYKYYKFEQAQDGTLKLKEVKFKDAENIGSLTGTETITNSNKIK